MTAASSELRFTHPDRQRFFEDYQPDSKYVLGSVEVNEQEVLEFAKRYDPQSIHTTPEFAENGPFEGLIASGWHTAGLMMSLYAPHYLSDVSSLASPGMDELRWLAPVRPGDVLDVNVHIVSTRRSSTKPDRGVVNTDITVVNQQGIVVMSMRAVNMILCRETAVLQ
ncbi:MAG: MaoC family dehydratase [Alphaproteobacteria bacterium]|jgi:acyl dehydratase|nr:MaoC family dehydratase [Alphaproteobacteria bacterium]MBT4019657.1 MaoC family dehydratase [Alphaproteobacteria bacterium]MBT4967074.1 MaoC family dehydratase [Alphaproteobacteria bacterium]MBT5161808.1 MaoC family dehydratase [Alphaproteobacteria bacterium]